MALFGSLKLCFCRLDRFVVVMWCHRIFRLNRLLFILFFFLSLVFLLSEGYMNVLSCCTFPLSNLDAYDKKLGQKLRNVSDVCYELLLQVKLCCKKGCN